MTQVQSRLSSALLWTALLLAAYYVTGLLTRPVGRLFGDAAGLEQAQTVALWAARAAFTLAVAAAAWVTFPLALRRGRLARRVRNVVPIWLLLLLVIGAVSAYLAIGTVGGLAVIDPFGKITFAIAWLAVIGTLAILVVVPTTARASLSPQSVRTASGLQMLAGVAALVAAGAMVVAVAIVLGATAAAPGGPGGSGGPGGAGGAAASPEAMEAQAALVATTKQYFAVGGVLIALFAVLALRSGLAGWSARRAMAGTPQSESAAEGGRSQFGGAVAAGLLLTAIVLVAIQPFRMPVDNPPATEAAVWDSAATADLVNRACMDCHSNEGTWPWYAHVAPSNWLTAGHVQSGRRAFNLSELDKLEPDKRASLGERMGRSAERGFMPTADYKMVHAGSNLTEEEITALVEGLETSLAVTE